jgi:membrane-associated phospholipid phosphatase
MFKKLQFFIKETLTPLFALSGKLMRRQWITFIAIPFLLAVLTCITLFPYDVAISDGLLHARQEHVSTYKLMKGISKYGDFGGVILVCVLMFVAGKLLGRRRLVMAGIAGFMAASCAGLLNDFIKLSGRPRPKARVEYQLKDGFYGPKIGKRGYWFDSKYQSFASGHTTTAVGAAAGICFVYPPVGVPLMAGAGLVGYSRVYISNHYPSDVMVGAIIGIFFGLLFARASREMLAQEAQQATH